jgi:hypothetical protein
LLDTLAQLTMKETRPPLMAECLHCGREFMPRRGGHVFCSSRCRHRYREEDLERVSIDRAAVERLFAADRDPEEQVRDDDWYPGAPEFRELYAVETVGDRRRWYRALARV